LLNGLLFVVVPLDTICTLQLQASGGSNAVYRYSTGRLADSLGAHEGAGISALLLGGGGCENCRDAGKKNRDLYQVHDEWFDGRDVLRLRFRSGLNAIEPAVVLFERPVFQRS
jgi:hypothetical protein